MHNFIRTTSIAVTLALGLLSCRGAFAEQVVYIDWLTDSVSQTIFHAVQEGLYADGVSNADVEGIIPNGDFNLHFVSHCPLCHPAYEAFKAYRTRPMFSGLKGRRDTFGKGLDASVRTSLRSDDRTVRMIAIQELIQKWVTRRLDSMRLTPAEKDEWRTKLAARRKQGMDALEKFNTGGPIVGWKVCAICDACASASGVACDRPVVMPFGELKPAVPPKVEEKKPQPKANETF